jgi:hypothetical protein
MGLEQAQRSLKVMRPNAATAGLTAVAMRDV